MIPTGKMHLHARVLGVFVVLMVMITTPYTLADDVRVCDASDSKATRDWLFATSRVKQLERQEQVMAVWDYYKPP